MLKSRILEIGVDNCHISLVTYAELYYGAVNSSSVEKNLLQLKHFIEGIDVVPIDDFDLLIGTTAKIYGMTLVTENIKHLGKVEGVTIENWVNR